MLTSPTLVLVAGLGSFLLPWFAGAPAPPRRRAAAPADRAAVAAAVGVGAWSCWPPSRCCRGWARCCRRATTPCPRPPSPAGAYAVTGALLLPYAGLASVHGAQRAVLGWRASRWPRWSASCCWWCSGRGPPTGRRGARGGPGGRRGRRPVAGAGAAQPGRLTGRRLSGRARRPGRRGPGGTGPPRTARPRGHGRRRRARGRGGAVGEQLPARRRPARTGRPGAPNGPSRRQHDLAHALHGAGDDRPQRELPLDGDVAERSAPRARDQHESARASTGQVGEV